MKKTGSQTIKPAALQVSTELKELQPLMPIDPADRERLKRDIEESGEVRDPLKVYYDRASRTYLIMCGQNRWEIARELGLDTVPIDVYEGTPAERRDLVMKDNLNRRHFTTEQKRGFIAFYLKQDPNQSNKSIAKKTGTTKETVQSQRKKLEAGGEIRPLTKAKGTDGKSYTTHRGLNSTPDKPEKKAAPGKPALTLDKQVVKRLDTYIRTFKPAEREAIKALLIKLIKEL